MKALKINPKNANTYFNLELYTVASLPKTAIRYFKQALKFNIYYNLSINYTKVDLLSKAVENLKLV